MNTRGQFFETFGVLREHLTAHALPDLASATVVHSLVDGMAVRFQLGGGFALTAVAAGLVAWAETLTHVTCSIWRVRDKEVHLDVDGRLSDGTAVKVFSGTDYAPEVFGLDLAVKERRTIPLVLLRSWSIDGSEVAA